MSRRNSDLPIWNFFERPIDGSKTATCNYCRRKLSFRTSITNLKQHLKQKHITVYNNLNNFGKTLESTAPETNADQNSNASSNDRDGDTDNENIFTEVVYLDPEPTESVTKKEKPKSYSKPVKKRERLHSLHSSDETPVKIIKKEEPEANDELSTFIKYITCLLKKLPPDAFSNVQVEIINAIQKANAQANNTRTIIFNKEQVNTCSNIITVDGITPISNDMVGHNYTITVAPQKQDEAES